MLNDLQQRLGLSQSQDYDFFSELAYMAANPNRSLPNYGMATNGDEFVFLKLGTENEYAVSRSFSLFPQCHELEQVAQILKNMGQRAVA